MWKNWREQAARCGRTLTLTQVAQYTREEVAYDRAVKTFENSEVAGMWMLRPSNELGNWITPNEVARASDEGLVSVLVALAAKAVEP